MAQKRTTAKRKTRAVDSAVVEGIVSSMVRIPGKDYWMGKFQVTQAQWKAVMGENPANSKGAESPVENISWNDCQKFLKKLNAQPAAKASGMVFRLPTEKEWVLAASAGAAGDYCKLADGTEITEDTLGEVAWFEENVDNTPHPVGQKKPNAFGLYDVFGNVFEWTATADGEDRVSCGGSWLDSADRCVARDRCNPSFRFFSQGFRLCASAAVEGTTIALPGSVELAMIRIPGKDYWMGKFPVTQAQWETVMGENPAEFKGAENPVENVSWNDCQTFIEELNAQPTAKASGLVFRLPEENEWEYACRAGSTGKYCKLADGTEITEETLGKVAWYGKNSWSGGGKTHAVGKKKPNAFGLYDMHGNVWEWTATVIDEKGDVNAFGEDRILRGGGWLGSARNCEFSYRFRLSRSLRHYSLGFRLCASGSAD